MIWIEVLGILWRPGIKLGLKKFSDFELWLSHKFVERTVRAIDSQSLAYTWAPLSPVYRRYKQTKGWSDNIWEATSEVKKGIRVKKGNRIIIGFDNRFRHKVSKSRYLDIARTLEFGSVVRNIPPRPLFRPIYRELDGNLDHYYKQFLQEKGDSL